MGKFKKLIMFLFLFLFTVGFISIPVSAKDAFASELSTNTTKIKAGDEVEILLSFKGSKNLDEDITAFEATLDYDENLFKEINQSNFESFNSWEELLYNPNNKQFVAINKSGKLKGSEVVKIKLTAKREISSSKALIKVKDVIASDGKQDMELNDSQVQIEVASNKNESTQGGVNENTSNINPSNTNNEKNNTANNGQANIPSDANDLIGNNNLVSEDYSSNAEDNEGESVNDKKNYMKLIAIISLIIFIILLIIIKKKLENEEGKLTSKNKVIFIVIVVIMILLQVTIIAKAIGHKGEVNGDGEVDYRDVSILQQHLIDLKQLPENLFDNGDVNSDGKITVTDLSLLVQKIEDRLVYDVEMSSSMENYYPKKNEDIQLRFSANVSYGANLEEVTINGQTYKVNKDSETNDYYVNINVGDTSGIKEFKFTKVKLNVGKEIKVNFVEKLDVLKEEPTIENYQITELTNEAKMQLAFDIKDTDGSMTASKIEVIEKETSQLVQEEQVIVGKNEFILNLEEDKEYILKIKTSYDLDSNELVDHEVDNSGSKLYSYDLKLNIDYKFEFNGLKTFDNEGKETNTFNKNQSITIKFNSQNTTKYKPKRVKVNDINYEVSEKESSYIAVLNGFDSTGEHEITVQEVTLENGRVFALSENNIAKVQVNKEKPEVQEININELDDILGFDVSLKINDTDASISKKKIVIKNDKDEVVFEKEFQELHFNERIEFEGGLSSKYEVEVVVDYDVTTDNSQQLKDQVIYTQTIDAKPRVNIIESKVSAEKVEKGQEVKITYKVETNKTALIKQLVVNNITAIANKTENNVYEISIPVGDKAGLLELKLTKVIFEDNVEVKVEKVDCIEILKSILSVNGYEFEEDYDNGKVKVHFNIDDLDKSFISGKVQLVKKDGTLASEENIKATGKNSVKLPVVEGEEYTLKVILDYQRDEAGKDIVREKVFLEEQIQMIRDYKLKISEIKTYDDKETKYFNRNKNIKVSFVSTNETKFIPVKAQINGKQYNLTKLDNNEYETVIDGFNNPGVSEITIEKVWMDNTKELNLEADNKVSIEILKEVPSIYKFNYEELEDGKVEVIFNIEDNENAFKKGKLTIKDKNNEVFNTEELKVGENRFTFVTNSSEEYLAEIFLDYDLDTNALGTGANEYTLQKVLEKDIIVSKELVELKDIELVRLYRKNGDTVEEVTEVNTAQFNPSEYLAKIIMKNIPTLYAEVKAGKVVNNEFRLVLKYDNSVQYEGSQKRNEVEVKFGGVDNGIAKGLTFDELIKIIQQDPTATINLTSDLDAKNINVSTAVYIDTFRGKINGNGYTIRNLNKPLFGTMDNAVIENLIIEKANVSGGNLGIIANNAIKSRFTNVHVKDSNISTWHSNYTGGFVGKAENETIIEKSSATNVYVKSYKRVGGIVGYLNNSKVVDSYVTGTIAGRVDGIGGIVGQTAGNSSIESCYANIKFDIETGGNNTGEGIGGIVGWSDKKKHVALKGNISIAKGNNGYRVTGTGYDANKSSKNYEISESELKSNADDKKIEEISIDAINENLFTKELKWNSEVWDLSGVNGEKLPTLNNIDPNNDNNNKKPANNDVYIPNFERISQLEQYNSKMEIAYHNMHILMPFYDARLYVDYGNKIAEDDLLNKVTIKSVIEYDENSKMITGINSDNYTTIKKIKVVFDDGQIKEYPVTFKKKLNDIASYKIDSLEVGYTPYKFILNKDNSVVDEVINKAKTLDYATDIASVTAEEESRLYVDYYNESIKDKINEVVIGILQNEDEYNLYLDNEILKSKIRNELFNNKQLEKLIYTYNYFEKWYKIDIGGIRISDLLYYNGSSIINKEYDIKKLTEVTMSIKQNYRYTTDTVNFYNNGIKPMINKSLQEFLEEYMKIEGFSNPDDWFKSNFKGRLVEKSIEGKEDEIHYRAWTLLKKRDNHILPILTAPQEDMYIISVPSQFIIGSLNRYNQHLNGQHEEMDKLMNTYADMIYNFYSVSSSFIENSIEILNSRVHIQYDTRFDFPRSGNQEKGTTQDPVIKWVYEAVNKFAAANGSGAYANGTDVYWVKGYVLGINYNFTLFTHETAHNQDGYYFYERRARRSGTETEDHADANIAQDLGDGSFVFNIKNDFNIENDVSNNLTLDRIKGKNKIHSYYKEMFETYYLLDYLTAQALLQLTPEQQAKLITQVTYPGDDNIEDGGRNTEYVSLTAEQIRDMKLKSIEDLYNNRIAFRAPAYIPGSGKYGGDNHYSIYWYQPFNNNGRSDSYSFKRLGFEMLGVGGYTNGYVAFRSTMTKTDLEALRVATGDPNITWKEYKIGRFKNVEENLNKVPYFDVNKAIELYKEALIKDSAAGNRNQTNNVRRVLYGLVKRATGDFTHSSVYEMKAATEIRTAQELINVINNNQMGSYKLVSDIDFTGINVSEQDAYILTTFLGVIDGNGFKIKGLTKPLFKRIVYANIKDIIIESPSYTGDARAAVAVESKNSMIEDLNISNANINRPIVGTTQGSLHMIGDIQNTIISNEIKSIDDLLKINETTTGLEKSMKYKLVEDIDVSSVTDANAIILGDFLGQIDGNGKKIYNLKAPLFEHLKGKVYNLKLEGANIGKNNRSSVAALAGESSDAVIENIILNDITINGRDNVGSLVGLSTRTTISKISASNINVTGHQFYAGGLIGRSFDSKIYDVAIEGELSIADTHNGGLIGALNRDTIERAYVNVDVIRSRVGDSRNKNAGLYGAIEYGPISLKDIVVVGNMTETLYKITPATTETEINDIAKYLDNVYEREESTGISNISERNTIKKTNNEELKNKTFYTEKLKWSEDIWDFSNIISGEGPQLKQ